MTPVSPVHLWTLYADTLIVQFGPCQLPMLLMEYLAVSDHPGLFAVQDKSKVS